jgi:hypothetical protein
MNTETYLMPLQSLWTASQLMKSDALDTGFGTADMQNA